MAGFVALGLAACKARRSRPSRSRPGWGGPPPTSSASGAPPTKEVDDAGQRVLIYEEIERTGSAEFSREVSPRYSGGGGIAPPPSTVGYNSYARSYLFWVDAAGKISRTQIRQP